MTLTIRTLQLLSLAVLTALGCASTSTVVETKPASNEAKAPEEATIQPASAPSLEPVYFDTDQAVLRADARASLEARAEVIRQHPELGVITIQGHCDERGSDEYNLALGERRARAAYDYLVSLGVPADRLRTVSYGKEIPVCSDSNEDCWQRNRRAKLTVSGKTQ